MSRVNTIGTYVTIIFFVVFMFGMVVLTGDEIESKNPNLDNASLTALDNINDDIDNTYTVDQLTIGESNLTGNSSFEATDAFQREFLESKSESNSKSGVIGKITGVPDLILNSIGIQQDSIILNGKALFGAIMLIFLSLALFKAWKTGGTD